MPFFAIVLACSHEILHAGSHSGYGIHIPLDTFGSIFVKILFILCTHFKTVSCYTFTTKTFGSYLELKKYRFRGFLFFFLEVILHSFSCFSSLFLEVFLLLGDSAFDRFSQCPSGLLTPASEGGSPSEDVIPSVSPSRLDKLLSIIRIMFCSCTAFGHFPLLIDKRWCFPRELYYSFHQLLRTFHYWYISLSEASRT